MIAVYVVARVRSYRDALERVFAGSASITIVGAAGHPSEALLEIPALLPDVVVLDVTGMDGPAWAREVVAAAPNVRLVAVGPQEEEAEVLAWARAGVVGFVGCDARLDTLVAAVEAAARGEATCSPRTAAILLQQVAAGPRSVGVARAMAIVGSRITPREGEIVRLIGEGLSNQQIARRLCIALPTVKNHVHNILEKLGVGSRHEAVVEIRRAGFTVRAEPSRPAARALVALQTAAGDGGRSPAGVPGYARSRRAAPSSLRMPVTNGTSSLV